MGDFNSRRNDNENRRNPGRRKYVRSDGNGASWRPGHGHTAGSSGFNQNRAANSGRNNDRRLNQRPSYTNRPERSMGFKYIEDLLTLDPKDVVFKLSDDKNGFIKLLNSTSISSDLIILILNLIQKVCEVSFNDVKIKLLTNILRSNFMDKLTSYIASIPNQSSANKNNNSYFWKDTDNFYNNLLLLATTVHEIIPSYSENIHQILTTFHVFVPLIEQQHAIHISDGIKESLKHLLFVLKKDIECLQTQPRQKDKIVVDELEPPNDFRDIAVVPTAAEILLEKSPYLRSNIINGAYKNYDHYLDIQFRLLREDFVSPLRKGIQNFLFNENKDKTERRKLENIRFYKNVMFLGAEPVNENYCYKVQFDFNKKRTSRSFENSKRFMFGSLICFTNDSFRTLLFGKVVERDVKLLDSGIVVIGFESNINIDFKTTYLMIESSIYFEPYFHVLNVLKEMDGNNFPMEKYIIRVETNVNPPNYLLKIDPVFYKIDGTSVWPLNIPDDKSFYNFNDSQLKAFKAALTEEFCIIQGPPGTGKTFLGLKIAHTLLNNHTAWFDRSPILVICFTNHALDQFLEGILPVTHNIIRVGGQSKNEHMKNFNLTRKRTRQTETAVHQRRHEVNDYRNMLKTINQLLDQIASKDAILDFRNFSEIEDFKDTWFAGHLRGDNILQWLLEGKYMNHFQKPTPFVMGTAQEMPLNNEYEVDHLSAYDDNDNRVDLDEFDDIERDTSFTLEPLISLKGLNQKLNSLYQALNLIKSDSDSTLESMIKIEQFEMEIYDTHSTIEYVETQLNTYSYQRNRRMPPLVDLQNPKSVPPARRWLVYFYYLDKLRDNLRNKYKKTTTKYQEAFRLYNDLRQMEDARIMGDCRLIGMTTTGAARLRSTIQSLKNPIVIVEEAAEVLEAHIIAALTKNCQHLILIGDHLQLKPGAADFKIETKYKLGVSLFERMVNNNIQCYTLNVQHRMKPEISSLIKPSIYEDLQDHESTLQRDPILGVEKCLYFIDHNKPESECQDQSKKNTHESTFLIALARHLILNGYKPEQITILAAYLGQMFDMLHEKRKPHNAMFLKDVRIAVLDNYQGEECDIILLSLVRSNEENKAGFLKIQNRVCVALSRARNGLYIIGNMKLFLNCNSENQIWDKVNETLQSQNAIGDALTLKCQIHPYNFTQVKSAEDFEIISEGGCSLPCNVLLACGHNCKRTCHVGDRDHAQFKCNEPCRLLLCDNSEHTCKKRCYEDCGPCHYPVQRHLNCGHLVTIACYINPDTYKCPELVPTKLPCNHETNKPCSSDPITFACPYPCNIRVDSCGHTCKRQCHIRVDPDHLKYKCNSPCALPKVGCTQEEKHMCTLYCYLPCEECTVPVRKERSCGHVFADIACNTNIENIICPRNCKKILPCGHPCKSKCNAPCGPCPFKVGKEIPVCGHKVTLKCSEEPLQKHCLNRICPRLLPCGHKCKNSCKSSCTEECREIVECNIQSPCGHVIKSIPCYLRDKNSPSDLLSVCSSPCKIKLKCGHQCSGTCGTCKQSRIHKRCAESCGVPLVCNHECPIPCRQACRPCTRPCEIKCSHNRCNKKCGEPCVPCKELCSRRCPHVRCNRWCGDICNVDPCIERCSKTLPCGHQCVGFCGDPCPKLCKICNEEELTEIFLGNEDEPDAIYVMLRDCGHIFEHTDLENWLKTDEDQIKFKVCPKCKTSITTTQRYSKYIKMTLRDIVQVKLKCLGRTKSNEQLRSTLQKELQWLKEQYVLLSRLGSSSLTELLTMLEDRLKPVRNSRRQPIGLIELNAVKSKIQILSDIKPIFKDPRLLYTPEEIIQLDIVLQVLLRSQDDITDQEIDDIGNEILRLNRIVQYQKIAKNSSYANNPGIQSLSKNIKEVVFANSRYTKEIDRALAINLKNLSEKVGCLVNITDAERTEIVKAMDMSKGHWYKCPNGHPYVIGECGGAMQIAKCFCGAQIGGTDHHLLRSNAHAGEMDGSERQAWPGGLY
ncbi:NFX1-type zinc finger-containing protein 1-like [Sitophilus oryzae]|uniref:NFX1-type zinc finger-containing protein 1-like n=1 Tax=Sitophilus oryzae TaxID=7048 RepID=A0A6J2XD38_SITOR|nr:NFX1-type zinc finger-containing protein 1-like [Sitophilus oryzae]XP_030749162.1 NFX1-type zinc finger-containing protein 1-like [Sitophilus oryzae]XP_030749163.1 NFX1-type zinc finger-containing protein 1-like [Sitophilus oryzae]